jgi:hypothetical protein
LAKVTTTHTKYLSTLTRPVYHTPVPNYPCYTDVFERFDPTEYTTIVWVSDTSPLFVPFAEFLSSIPHTGATPRT